MNDKQIDIITSLMIDNGLIYNEINDSCLVWNPTFNVRIITIKDYCYHLYMDALNGEVDVELALNRITHLMNELAKYRDSYTEFDEGTVGHQMYRAMNSFFDKTSESFEEFFNTL